MPKPGVEVLLGIGAWLKVNGAAIYDTRPWLVYGEGPVRNGGGGLSESTEKPYTSHDLRFTRSKDGKTLYVIALGWPEAEFTVQSLQVDSAGPDARVELLGAGPVQWKVNDQKQLVIEPPAKQVGEHAFAFRVSGMQVSESEAARFEEPTAQQLEPGAATLEGDQIRTQVNEERVNVGFWDKPEERIHWLVRIPAAGTYAVRAEVSSANGPSGLKLSVEQQSLTARVPATDGWFKPVFVRFGTLHFDQPGVCHVIQQPSDLAAWHPVNVYKLQVAPER